MRLFLFFLFAAVPFVLAGTTPTPNPDEAFFKAVSFLCTPHGIDFVPSAERTLREELTKNPTDVTTSLLLGLSYAQAVQIGRDAVLRKSTFKPDQEVAKRVTLQNAETLLRTALAGLSKPWRPQDKERFERLKAQSSCRLSSDTQLAGLLAAALRGLNPKRTLWKESATTTLEEFEGYFLLGPGSSFAFPASRENSVVYDVRDRKAYLRQSGLQNVPVALAESLTLPLSSGYTLRVRDRFLLGGSEFFYVLVTSDRVFTEGLNGRRVALEAGHFTNYGTQDPGSVYKTLREVDVNRQVRSELIRLLSQDGVQLVPSAPERNTKGNAYYGGRYGDYLYDEGWKPYVRWVSAVHNQGQPVDAFVSIHHNVRTNLPASVVRDFTEGYFGPKSQSLGRCLVKGVRASIHSGVRVPDLIPTRKNSRTRYIDGVPPQVPRVLLEVQFTKKVYELTQAKPSAVAAYVKKASRGIFDGLTDYFRGNCWPDLPVFDPQISDW